MKSVKEWMEHYDAKPSSVTNPIELVEFCINGVPLDRALHRQAILEPTIARLELMPHHHFLEIGCGSGLLLSEIENKVSRSVGTDISRRLLDSFEGRSEKIVCAADEIPFEKETFDRILMFSVAIQFESFEYFARVVNKAVSVLKKGGIFLIGDLLLGTQPPHSQYLHYDKHRLIDFLDSLQMPYSIMAQSPLKRTINKRYDVALYKD